ncbi:MAG: hypothetical protein J0L67_09885 [Cytophagales bacterium]|nr:hypothetical protein [Cytophagales bacterium]
MAFIRDIITLFQNKRISVTIDPLLLPHIDSEDRTTLTREVSFNIYRLIYHIGTIQSRRFATSNRLKFFDKTDLVEKIYDNTEEFRVKINEIRQVNGSETLTTISEDFGIGISVILAENLFSIKRSTIQKIYGTGRRPDWKCQMTDNRILVTEGKGSISIQTSNNQEADAIDQKSREPGDIKIASLTVINEDSISETRFLDPPAEGSDTSPIMENHILRAGHYASVFSFLGNSKLSMYYSQMRKRLEGLITPEEQGLKDEVFWDLKYNYPSIHHKNEDFVGTFYQVEDNKYIFVGVDKRLLSYRGFINYLEFEGDTDEIINDNHFILYRDGVLLIEIINLDYFGDIVNREKILNYQENITISDIDEMNEISFTKSFIYILQKNGFVNIIEESLTNNLQIDLKATLDNIDYYFEFKLFKSKRISNDVFQQLRIYKNRIQEGILVLVTNATVDSNFLDNNSFKVIDREKLEELTRDFSLLKELIE